MFSPTTRRAYTAAMQTIYHALIPTLWLLWLAVWVISAFRTKPVARAETIGSRLSHLIPLGLGATLLTFHRFGGSWLAMRVYPQTVWSFWSGAALVALGLGFAVWARVHLAGNWSGTVTLKQDHSLTRTGPYRLARHPIYTGILLAILGSAIAEAEWRGFVALALVALAFLRKIAIEERFLTAQFGDAYARYRAEVPTLVPWPRG
ncbi:MAG TPA: isoprenylcysteine carboxylmethyltransferase family protein [Acetobacteraceae bacterium]|nr:isoprenylcysteine carboxylmethyltransferase family protein [Acetobacteraceae bacterium]